MLIRSILYMFFHLYRWTKLYIMSPIGLLLLSVNWPTYFFLIHRIISPAPTGEERTTIWWGGYHHLKNHSSSITHESHHMIVCVHSTILYGYLCWFWLIWVYSIWFGEGVTTKWWWRHHQTVRRPWPPSFATITTHLWTLLTTT